MGWLAIGFPARNYCFDLGGNVSQSNINTYSGNGKLDIKTLEGWLWDAACKIRGEVDAPKYKDYILPIVFIKRLSDVFEDELGMLSEEYGDVAKTEKLLKQDHSLVRFYIPEKARWGAIALKSTSIGEYMTDAVRAIARENPKLSGVVDIVDFNATTTGQRIITDDKLKALVDVLGKYRLGLEDVEPDILGRAYEYLLRKFAEGSGSSAGEFYTPREVAVLIAHIIDPGPGETIYDPACGSLIALINLGKVDAVIGWNAFKSIWPDSCEAIELPRELQVFRSTAVAIVSYTKNLALSEMLIEFLKSDEGKKIYSEYGWFHKI